MKKFFKQLFCWHDWDKMQMKFYIPRRGKVLYRCTCKKCGKVKFKYI